MINTNIRALCEEAFYSISKGLDMEQANQTALVVVESNLKASKEALNKRIADNKALRIHLNKSGESGSGFTSGGIAVLDTIDMGLFAQIKDIDNKLRELGILMAQDNVAKIFA